jgi:hypothetical protein
MVYGCGTHNCELFSDIPDEIERQEYQVFQMLLQPDVKGK